MGVEKLPLIAEAAVDAELKSGCPRLLLAAQCILESGWLSAAPGNNCFGIKSYSGEHGRQLLETREWLTDREAAAFLARGDGRTAELFHPEYADGRKLYFVHDWFATFASLTDCFVRRAALFSMAPYASFAAAYRLNGDFTAMVRGIGPIYATDPHYADRVLQIANQDNVSKAIADAWMEANLW